MLFQVLYVYFVNHPMVEAIIKALLVKDGNHLEYEHVLDNALSLAAEFHYCMFAHVKRLGNLVAHFMARCAKSGNELQVWIESILNDIALLVTCDCV